MAASGGAPANPTSGNNIGPSLALSVLGDLGSLSGSVNGHATTLTSAITPGLANPHVRTYTITVTTPLPIPLLQVNLTTRPDSAWTYHRSFPQGPDYLPGLSQWQWTITSGAVNDTSHWKAYNSVGILSRTILWANATYVITGRCPISMKVVVNPAQPTGSHTTSMGIFVGNMALKGSPIPVNDPDFTQQVRALHTSMFRFSADVLAPSVWNNATHRPVFDFTNLTPVMNLSVATHNNVYLSVPAGTWQDGNRLPVGMPLNTSLVVDGPGHHTTGYFPTASAYSTYIHTFASGVSSRGWKIAYWNIGNEVPIYWNTTVAHAFVPVFNAASKAIHAVFPNASVGSDVLAARHQIDYYATHLVGVGFLAFHYYALHASCQRAPFCAPNNVNGYLSDGPTLGTSVDIDHQSSFLPPEVARVEWHNQTGTWLPVIDSETNLNSAWRNGTDTRQQTLFNAAWLASTMIRGSQENLSNLVYFNLLTPNPLNATASSPYGGWQYGALYEGAGDADVHYSTWWTIVLWNSYFRGGSPAVQVSAGNSFAVRAYAAQNGTGANVLLVNRAAVTVQLNVSAVGAFHPSYVSTLDRRSYNMVYNGSAGLEQLKRSAVANTNITHGQWTTVTLVGYGIAVVAFAPGVGIAGIVSTHLRGPSTPGGSGAAPLRASAIAHPATAVATPAPRARRPVLPSV